MTIKDLMFSLGTQGPTSVALDLEGNGGEKLRYAFECGRTSENFIAGAEAALQDANTALEELKKKLQELVSQDI